MKTRPSLLPNLTGLAIALILTACNMPGNAAIGFVPSAPPSAPLLATDTPASGAMAVSPYPSPIVAQPSQTDTPPEPTALPIALLPTPVIGPSIAHLAPGKKFDITYIHMADGRQGWGIGGLSQASDHVFHTKDAGQTWQDVTPPQPAADQGQQLQALGAFRSAASAWVIFSLEGPTPAPQTSLIWYTTDGGQSWKYSALDTSEFQETFMPSDMVFVDGQHGWFLAHVGAGMNHDYVAIISTSDGGQSWKVILDPFQDGGIQSCPKHAMLYADTQTGWLTQDCIGPQAPPALFKTTDGGTTWQPIEMPAPVAGYFDNNSCGMHAGFLFSATSAIFSMQCLDNDTFKIEHDFLYSTTDGGGSWKAHALPSDFKILDLPSGGLYFIDADHGMALGRGIYRTADGGKTWSVAKQVNWDGQFSFLDLNLGWAVATNAGQIALVKTINGGSTWTEIKPVVVP